MGLEDAMATTYVIGAGASRHAKYPLAWDMGKGVIDFMRGMPVPFLQQAQVLPEQFGAEPNIEEMIRLPNHSPELARTFGNDSAVPANRPRPAKGNCGRGIKSMLR
jgi:hypothetical protein